MMEVRTASELVAKKCLPCEGGVDPMTAEQSKSQLEALPKWELSECGKWIYRKWNMKNFIQAMSLMNAVSEIAEVDQHHPDLHLTDYRKLKIKMTTHAINGLSENDFILAAKIDEAAEKF